VGTVRPFQSAPFQYVYSMVVPIGTDGTFRVEWPRGNWILRAQATDGSLAADTSAPVTVGETTRIEITMRRTGVVRGVVTDEQGRHVAGAEVFVKMGGMPPTASREQYARSDPEGAFEVPGLPLEKTVLHVTHPEHADTKIEAVPELADKASEITVRLRRGATVRGRVLDAAGNGVAGEQVNLVLSWFEATTTFCDAQGSYAFAAVAPGTYTMTTGPYEQNARGLTKQGVRVGEDGEVVVDFEYPAAEGRLTGEVRLGGAPVPGAQVTVQDARGPDQAVRVVAAENGTFEATGLQFGQVRVVARTGSGDWGDAGAEVPKDGAPPHVVVTIGASRVRGVIVDEEQRPVSGCWLNLESDEGEHADWSRMRWQGNSGADGSFEATGLTPGSLRLRVNRAEFAQYLGDPFALGEGEARDLGRIVLRRGTLLTGVVRNDAGTPVEDATVSVKDAGGRPVFLFSMGTTGSDGRYSLRGLVPGSYTVRFEARGHAPDERTVTLSLEGATADGTLTRGGSVSVQVEDEGGHPVPDARVYLYDPSGSLVTRTISLANFDTGRRSTDASGHTRLDDLAQGTYRVEVRKDGWAENGPETRVYVEPGGVASVRIGLRTAP